MGQQNSSLTNIFIPTIVVFGDQSSGKSSVLKRLVGLPLPIGSIKCTCAPFEIRMIPSREPLRKISLRYVEDKNRKPTTPREIEFANIMDLEEEEIEEKLREAQRYALNPSINFKNKIKGSLPHTDELPYTKNTVCIIISGPDRKYDLCLVDLPGIVRNDENHEKFLLSLAKEYIIKETSILMPVFQATVDIDTQCAYRLAQEVDPNGQRTVGVLTKMDRVIEYHSEEELKHLELATLVKNRVYVIRNPSGGRSEDPNELEKATVEALKRNKTWSVVPSDRFGLQNLIIRLGEIHQRVRFQCTIS
ncbi:hypothetical protein RclHR1_03300021 [Rhizophagus clarus]|uniref:Dynamin GTPase domain-containing protein n=1 Tax=Rhizophagus clarus TaxID=94130 RepID=A0A2Z6RQA2_9GLOM|nr:hypothetical protein RclHR1_03300021 [Rhizophagus clarus]